MKFNYLKNISHENINQVIELDEIVFKNQAWSMDSHIHSLNLDNYYIDAFMHQDVLVGFTIYSTVIDEAELLKIAVNEDYRNKKIASNLIINMVHELKIKNINKLFLEVNEKNYKAIKLYQKNNFKIISKRKNYYENNENALIMQLNIE